MKSLFCFLLAYAAVVIPLALWVATRGERHSWLVEGPKK